MTADDSILNIKIKKEHTELTFRVRRQTPFQKMFNAFCTKLQLDQNQLVFLGPAGEFVRPEQAPEQLGLEDGDEISANMHQVGGGRLA